MRPGATLAHRSPNLATNSGGGHHHHGVSVGHITGGGRSSRHARSQAARRGSRRGRPRRRSHREGGCRSRARAPPGSTCRRGRSGCPTAGRRGPRGGGEHLCAVKAEEWRPSGATAVVAATRGSGAQLFLCHVPLRYWQLPGGAGNVGPAVRLRRLPASRAVYLLPHRMQLCTAATNFSPLLSSPPSGSRAAEER